MMKANEASELLNTFGDMQCINIVIVVNDLEMYAEEEIRILKEKGYASFLRQTAMGFEVVITDKISDAKIGFTRPETP